MTKPTIALFHPDIPQNVGAAIRNCVCFEADLHLIRPFGFFAGQKQINKVALDYGDFLSPQIYNSSLEYLENNQSRKILFSTKGRYYLNNFSLQANDILCFGSESSGASEDLHEKSDFVLRIAISPNSRSLNLATSVAIVLYEYRRQFPL